MKSYICPRCGHRTDQKNNIRRHFARKKECPIKYANISIEKCIELVFSKVVFIKLKRTKSQILSKK